MFYFFLNRQLDQIASETPKSKNNMETVMSNDEKSRQLINSLDNVVKSLPNHLIAAQQLNKDTDKTIKDVTQSNKQCKIV